MSAPRPAYALFSTALFAILLSGTAVAAPWADKMFEVKEHDFGTVARGSDTVYKFEVINCFEEDVHIQNVRSSCGCTSPSIENNTIKTWEKGYIVAKFNTRGGMTGHKSATLTVTIDKPFPAQVQLKVRGNIRGDLVFEPGSVDFADVDQGAKKAKTVQVRYAGHSGWKIEDVVTATESSEFYGVELVEKTRAGGVVHYDLKVELSEAAPAGFLQDQLVLVTNDRSNPRIPLKIEGRVNPEIVAAPSKWVMGEVGYGQQITKKFVIRGKKEFQITKVNCGDGAFKFDFDKDKVSKTHMVTAVYSPGDSGSGNLRRDIRIETSLGDTYFTQCTAFAKVKAPADVDASKVDSALSSATSAKKSDQ